MCYSETFSEKKDIHISNTCSSSNNNNKTHQIIIIKYKKKNENLSENLMICIFIFHVFFSVCLLYFRSIIAECLASFLYVFIVCGAAAGAGVGASVSSVLLATALASGFVVTTLTQCFSHISGKRTMPKMHQSNEIYGI